MYDLLAKSESEYTGQLTGVVFRYRPPGGAIKNEVGSLMVKNGIPEDAEAEGMRHIVELRLLYLKCCLTGIDGLQMSGQPFELTFETQKIGGFPVKVVHDDSLGMLADGDLGSDLVDFADHIMASSRVTVDEKNELAGQ